MKKIVSIVLLACMLFSSFTAFADVKDYKANKEEQSIRITKEDYENLSNGGRP